MNKLLLPILIWMFSCQSVVNDGAVETFGEAKSVGEIASCNCEDLVKNESGILILKDKIFTGVCLIKYQGTDLKYIEKQILNGVINGKISYYGKDGVVLFEEHFNQGEMQLDLSQESIRCNCKILTKKMEQNKNRKYYKNQLFTGTCFDVYPDSEQPYFEAAYKNGERNGFTSYYEKGGKLLFTEKYRNDTLIKVIEP